MDVILLAAAAFDRIAEAESGNQRGVLLAPSAVLFTRESTHAGIVAVLHISWVIKKSCQRRTGPDTRRSWILHEIISKIFLDLDSV